MVSKTTLVTGACLVVVGALLYAGLRLLLPSQEEPLVDSAEIPPQGRWHLQVPPTPRGDGEELARLLSLPYAPGKVVATGRSGVTIYRPDRADPGVNLYVSGHGPEAILMDLEGNLLHRWRYPFEEAFPGKAPTQETGFFRRARLDPSGRLLAIFQGGGLIRLDRDSRLLWAFDAGFYNDLFVAPDGSLYGITKRANQIPWVHPTEPVLEDFITVVSPEGEFLWELPILQAFAASPFRGLLVPMPPGGDIFHTNTVKVLDGRLAHRSPLFQAGNLLVSLREVDVVAILDPRKGEVVWAARGPWRAQHDPLLLDSGRLLLFDNRGAAGRSRVLEYDPLIGEILWEYQGPPGRPLHSPEAGACQPLANGHLLITESEQGRALEITREGEIVWEFLSPHRAGPRQELVATLFEVQRLEAEVLRFLTSPN